MVLFNDNKINYIVDVILSFQTTIVYIVNLVGELDKSI